MMAVLTRLVLVAVLVTSGSVEGARLSINPVTVIDGKTPTLTVRCDTDAPSTDNVYVIRITKPPSIRNLAIVDIRGAIVDTSIQQRATATGSIATAAGSNLVLTFNDSISCSDAGDYMCTYSSQISQAATVNESVQATSNPSNIEMVVRPNMVSYRVNDTVELVCSGYIGKPVNGSWVWETRDVTSGSAWTPLRPGLTPVDGTPAESGACQMTGNSTLTFQVQGEDDNHMYRCYFRDPEYSANFTFNVMIPATSPPEELTTPLPTSACAVTATTSQDSSGLSMGAAVAISVVLTFLLTLAATLAVVFLLLRHRLMPGTTANNGTNQDGNYSGLDLSTREPPKVNNVYNHVDPYAS